MASQPQPLRPPLPCASAKGNGGAGLAAGSPEKGNARPKPPVRPKPRVLPKPAVPAKPCLPHPPPGPRHPRPELPSAEKINRLAGPKPYTGGGSGGALKRPSFSLKSPETPNGKGLPSPPLSAAGDVGSTPADELPPAPLTPSRKGPAPFKVTPVPVAAKLERFPGTTVEEILAKMDSKEGPGSPDRARLSPFCPDVPSRFGSKTFTAFRRRPSGEADGDAPGEAHQAPQPAGGELGTGDDGCPIPEMSGSPPAGPSCAGDPRGRWRPPSPPDLSSLQPGTLGPPGSPRPPACPAPAPGAPFRPAELSASAPGSPDAPPELLAPDSATLAPGSPESPAQPPAEVSAASIQAPGAPSSVADPRLGVSRPPGSPHTPSEGSPDTASPPTPGTPELPPRVTCSPGSPEAVAGSPGPPSPDPEPPARVSRPPGSPEGPDDSPVSQGSPDDSRGPDFDPPSLSRDSGLRRSSEGVLQPPTQGQGMGQLGGSLSALPRPGDPPSERSLGSESGWSLSQSFEWTFPSRAAPRGAKRLGSPPRSPIRETPDSGLSEEGESDGEGPSPCPPGSQGDSGSEEPSPEVARSRGAEGDLCPGGPVAQREAEASTEEEEEEEVRDGVALCSPLYVSEPDRDPAEAEPPAQPCLLREAVPQDTASEADSAGEPAQASGRLINLQGPGGPGQAEGCAETSKGPDPHADPGWLTELLASPVSRGAGHGPPDAEGPEDLLGWSRKDLRSEFGIGGSHQAGTFDWTREAAAGKRDWPGETEQDREFGTKSSWDSTRGVSDADRQDGAFGTAERDWGSDYRGPELMGEMRLGHSDWSSSRGASESCLQDQDFDAGKPKWGTGYGLASAGSREEIGPGKADWSRTYGGGHGQQQDKELSSRQPSWAGRYSSGDAETQDGDVTPAWAGEYGTGDAEIKDREITPDWASNYSKRDAETKGEDFTLGWAGRSSTGDTGTAEKEIEDREITPDWASNYSKRDAETKGEDFTLGWAGRSSTGDTGTAEKEIEDREITPDWASNYSKRDAETKGEDFTLGWAGRSSTGDTGTPEKEFCPNRPAWDSKYNTKDMESQDREFSPSRPTWDSKYSARDMESQDREFSPSRPAWPGEYSARDMESQDREFSPSRPAEASKYSAKEMESQDREFSPSRPAWDSKYSPRDMESQDREFSPSRPAWADEYGPRDVETQHREFSPSRPAEASEYSPRGMESQDREFSPSRPAWDSEYGPRDMETQHREFSPSRPAWASDYSSTTSQKEDREFSAGRLSWADERSVGQTEPANAFGVGKGDLPGARAPDHPAREPGWSSSDKQESGAIGSRDWGEELGLGGAERQNQFGIIGTDRVPDPSRVGASSDSPAPWASEIRSRDLQEPPEPRETLRDWHRDLSFSGLDATSRLGPGDTDGEGPGQTAWDQGPGSLPVPSSSALRREAGVEEPDWSQDLSEAGWSMELCEPPAEAGETEAGRQEWASAFGARCAAQSRDFGAAEQSRGASTSLEDGSPAGTRLSDRSPVLGDALADPLSAASPLDEPPTLLQRRSSTDERDLPELAPAPQSPRASSPLLEAAGGTLPEMESQEAPSDHPDGKRPPSWEEERLSWDAPQPEGPEDLSGQDFTFLEDTEILDSTMYRSKAQLGRKRGHRAPALRPGAAAEGDSWIFQDSTEPRAARAAAASDDDEAAEEPKSRRARASPSGKGVKVPLFPGLNASALKAKLRGRNRSAEEGAQPGDGKATPGKDPHVQRSKSCKIPSLSGKPLALPPKPEKSSGSDASPPHWLQALKLKKKKS
ncbi:182 kDa tankyrase-1-binding protein [Struthio camelus]|uniref:182 kDa tankyrase-1-binding protein n=1 Tax=Struthio camelus TaxID=8801 RepID=UPI003603B3D5